MLAVLVAGLRDVRALGVAALASAGLVAIICPYCFSFCDNTMPEILNKKLQLCRQRAALHKKKGAETAPFCCIRW